MDGHLTKFTEAEAEEVRKVTELPFGDRLDRLVVAIADALPDRPAERLSIAVAVTLEPNRAGTISCISGAEEDIRWAFRVLGVPTRAIPKQMLFWDFGH